MLTEQFEFPFTTFNGPFFATTAHHPDPPNAKFGWKSFASLSAVLNRSDSEILVDLGPAVTKAFLPIINKALGNEQNITLTSGPFAQIALWQQVPYFLSRLLDHPLNTTLLRIDFNLHIHTPWWMSDADANVSFYIFVRLDSGGHLRADVDGAWVIVNGGWPDGQAIADKLGAIAISEIATVNNALHAEVAQVAGGTFKSIYLIPGNGSKAAFVQGDASLDTSLAVAV